MKNCDWTISKTGLENVRYGLWNKAINRGWFDSSKQAIEYFNELTKG